MKRRLSYDQITQLRIKQLFSVLVIGYLLLATRFVYIQVIRAPYFKDRSEELTVRRILLPAKRGTIYDRNGKKLAVSVDAYDIYAQPVKIKNKKEASEKLAPILGIGTSRLLEIFNSGKKFVYLERRVDVEVGDKIKEAKVYGTGALTTVKRIYPGKSFAAHILGFTNVDGVGISGLEKAYDKDLRGRDGYVVAQVDARGKVIPGSKRQRVEPINGKNIYLTIDATIQHTLETALEESYKAYSAAGASAVVMDPKTGEILALANMPTFDPNYPGRSSAASHRNRAITDLYEPGSTLKTMTVCAGLEEGVIDAHDVFHCRGSMRIGKRTIRCSLHAPFMAGHGTVDSSKILRYSCNMGAAGIGLRLGKEKLHKYEQLFGFYENPGTGMTGEISGWRDKWQDWADVRVANIAFGQGIAVTPMQMTKAYSAVANNGVLMHPYIIKEITLPDGTPEQVFNPKMLRRVVSEETAAQVSEMLYGVVSEAHGTGKPARVEGYRVGGKTGSAQKASTTGRGYAAGRFIASFVGYLPITDPRIVVLVTVDEPKGIHWGAVCAAPVFQKVAKEAMWYMKVPPDALPKPAAPVADEGRKHKERDKKDADVGGPLLGG